MWPHRLRYGIPVLPLALLMACGASGHTAGQEQQQPHRAPAAAPEPAIVSRQSWHADEHDVREKPVYTGPVEVVFVHHTDNANDYDCKRDVPAMLRAIEEQHIDGQGWDDLGYNFLVDRCGTIYEGRAGGVGRPVRGAHTEGFNTHSVGIAAIGHFEKGQPVPRAMLEAIAEIAAWKLPPDVDPRGRVRLVSHNDASRYPKGTAVEMNVISGHRDAYETDCPGDALYGKLPWLRRRAAQLRHAAAKPPPLHHGDG
ncbi:N-acetylmuramoyl-L-alanine amidase [Streptomyces montanisoli]|uniref:N-acetylmuramoyl-L-alanine amidase n=1 Tax=Streptomyces montanisoli TaxID=2798581 RepID=A0A940MBB5_9ACTN|nr:N-acetylmuramoyl-L-alanine amidase [Streptomyces montanisoli]MBP0458149.1 N-acetylmuramoyl-L-alanine amidase [Streptomyces montanisoli]